MTALLMGTLLALGALAYVLWPLIAAEGRSPAPLAMLPSGSSGPGDQSDAVTALREIEFDHVTGKLSDSDYGALKARYTAEAVAAMRARDSVDNDAAETEIRRARAQTRVCKACGPRPEPGARYCSRCGAALT